MIQGKFLHNNMVRKTLHIMSKIVLNININKKRRVTEVLRSKGMTLTSAIYSMIDLLLNPESVDLILPLLIEDKKNLEEKNLNYIKSLEAKIDQSKKDTTSEE